MGVSTEAFTFYGVKLDWNDEFAEAYDDYYDALESVVILDGMGGDYIVIGAKLFESGDSRWDAMSGFGIIDVNSLDAEKKAATDLFLEHMPEFSSLIEGEWKLMTFIHYS